MTSTPRGRWGGGVSEDCRGILSVFVDEIYVCSHSLSKNKLLSRHHDVGPSVNYLHIFQRPWAVKVQTTDSPQSTLFFIRSSKF